MSSSYHMPPGDFERHLRNAGAWLTDYWRNVEKMPVVPRIQPGDVLKQLPVKPPLKGEPFETVMDDFKKIIVPATTHWQSPNFFAFFSSNSSPSSVLGEFLSAGLGVQGMLWITSPAATELEMRVMDWSVDLMGLPAKFKFANGGGGVIQDSASSATLCALLGARERASNGSANLSGTPPNLRVYATSETHSSIEKGVRIAGIGANNLRYIAIDDDEGMNWEALNDAIENDIEAGLVPCAVVATVGTTSSTATDPLRKIGEICRRHGIWLHVDAAHAGSAMVCPEFRHLIDGLELADSYCYNPQKWMFTNLDCSCLFVANSDEYTAVFDTNPIYLRNDASQHGAVDYRNWQIPLGRRFRALKLWFVFRHYGIEGLQFHIREHIRLAHLFAELVTADDRFVMAAPLTLNLVCFRHKGGDQSNLALLNKLNSSGKLYLTSTVIKGRVALRINVAQTNTQERHVRAAWDAVKQAAEEL